MTNYEKVQLAVLVRKATDALRRASDEHVWTEVHRDTLIEIIETIDRLFRENEHDQV